MRKVEFAVLHDGIGHVRGVGSIKHTLDKTVYLDIEMQADDTFLEVTTKGSTKVLVTFNIPLTSVKALIFTKIDPAKK